MAQGKSDGTVYIDTKMDTSGVGRGIEETKRKLTSATESVKRFGDNVRKSFEGTSSRRVGRSYEEVSKDIKKAEMQLDRLIEKQIRFVETGGNVKSRSMAGMEYDIEMARNNLFGLREELAQTEKAAPKSMHVLKRGVDNTTKSIKKMSDASKKSHYSIMRMLGTSLLFSIVFRAISTATQGFVDGMNNLVQYSDKANNTMSTLKSSLTQLKNSFATAFMPVITIVTPALLKLMDVIIKINNFIAQLFAALSGKNTYTKAISVQEDYAKSLKGTAAAAKEAKNNLSGLDELTIVSKEESGGGVSPEDMFEEVPIDNKIIEFLEKIKNAFDKLAKKLKELAEIFKKGFLEGLGDYKSKIEIIKKSLQSIKESLIDIFTDANVVNAMNEYIESFVYMLGQIVGAIASIGLTIGANLLGGLALYLEENSEPIKEYLISMFDIGTEINTLVGDWFTAIADIFSVFATETGIEFTAGLIGIFATAFMGITEICATFAKDFIALITKPVVDSKDQIKGALDDLLSGFSSVFGGIKTILEDVFNFVMQVYNEIISPVIDNTIKKLTDLIKNHIAPMFSQLGEFLDELGQVVTLFWEEILQPFIQWIIDNILPVLTPILDGFANIFVKSFEIVSDSIKLLTTALTGLIQFVKGFFYIEWGKAWEGLKNDFDKIVGKMSEIIKGFIDGALELINKVINGINGISDAVGADLSIPNVTQTNIPKLATGAVIPPNAPFLAMLGDQTRGTNIEAPADLIRQIVREETAGSREMMDLLTQIAQNTRETADKDLTIGDREIARANLRGQSSMGYSLIVEG